MAEPFDEIPAGTDDALIGSNAGDVKQTDIIGFVTAGGESQLLNNDQTMAELLGSTIKPQDELQHDVTSYLGRFTRLSNFVFGASDVSKTLFKVEIMDWLRTDERAAMYRRKLQGFFGMSATAEIMIQLNANPMEAGIIGVCFKPFLSRRRAWDFDENPGAKIGFPVDRLVPATLTQNSQYPGCWLNIASESSSTFSVPYIGPNVYINLLNPLSQWGTLVVYGVTNVSSATGKSDVDVNLYIRFKDVKLFGATKGIEQGITPSERQEADGHPFAGHAFAQGMNQGAVNNTGPGHDDYPSSDVGDEEGFVTDIGKFAVPLVNMIAPEASAFTNTALALANAFGLSKPNAHPEHQRRTITPFGQMQNTDGTSNAFKLSSTADQNLEIVSMGLTEKDETSISYIAQQPSYLASFEWAASAAVHEGLAVYPVNPNVASSSQSTIDGATVQCFQPTFLRFAAQQFAYWRGGIRFTFHIAGTKFHSGRLRFIYTMGNTPPTLEHGTVPLYYSQVIDIRDASVFTIECPYISTVPWKQVPNGPTEGAHLKGETEVVESSALKEEDAWLYVIVETALRAPDSVAQKLEVAVVVSACEDFDVACPSFGINNAVTLLSDPVPAVEQGPLIPTDAMTFSMTGADTVPLSRSDLPLQHCAGERNLSFRALLKKYVRLGRINTGENTEWTTITPFFIGGNRIEDSSDELLKNIHCAYVFWRGGMRYILRSPTKQDILVEYSTRRKIYNLGKPLKLPISGSFPVSNGSTSYAIFDHNIQGGAEIQVPYYSQFPMLINGDERDVPSYYNYEESIGWYPKGNAAILMKGECDIYRAVADDYNLGYLVAPPPTICGPNINKPGDVIPSLATYSNQEVNLNLTPTQSKPVAIYPAIPGLAKRFG